MGLPNPSPETNFSGANGDKEIVFGTPVVQLTTGRVDNQPYHPIDPSLAKCMCVMMTMHTYIHALLFVFSVVLRSYSRLSQKKRN